MAHITDAQADADAAAYARGREDRRLGSPSRGSRYHTEFSPEWQAYCDGWRAEHAAITTPVIPPIPATGDAVRDEWAGWINLAGALSRGNEPPLPDGTALPGGRVVGRPASG